MDYEKEYKSLVAKVKKAHQFAQTDSTKSVLEDILPQLRESEDERVIRTLYYLVRDHDWLNGATKGEALTWLEKQKESLHITETCKENDKSFADESEDERIRRAIVETIKQCPDTFLNPKNRDQMLSYLEKQKGDKEELVYRLNGLMQDYIKEGKDDEEKEHRLKCYQLFWDALEDANFFEQKEQIPYIDFVIKPHKGDDNNPYDMRVSEAQEYAIKRGFGVPFNDGEVYVDERHMTQTIGNILRWADEHPKEQKEPHFTKRNALFDECVEKCDTAIMKKVSDKVDEMLGKEQKPADDKAFEEWIDDWWKHNKVNNPDSYDKSDEIQFDEKGFKNFCRGIRNMYANQESAEGSEEDEKFFELLHAALYQIKIQIGKDEYDRAVARLKSLRSSWKPSKEQMNMLKCTLDYYGSHAPKELVSLYEDLKKL